jgi:FKBP-type peptidyl-prolyl cis-trans isomerase FklB
MKKLNIIIALTVIFSFSLSANPTLRNRTDSLNYVFGLLNGDGIRTFYLQDDDSIDERLKNLMRGIEAGMKQNPQHANFIEIGTNLGQGLRAHKDGGLFGSPSLATNIALVKQGLINGIFGFDQQMSVTFAQTYLETTIQRLQEIEAETLFGENRREGEVFLAENRTKQGIVTTESGLQYRVITTGRGRTPTINDRVRVHYHGTLLDGTVFDSSVQRGESIVFPVSGVISGWTEALQLMPVGSKWVLYIPQELAYGSQGAGGMILPYSALIFEVELLGIE